MRVTAVIVAGGKGTRMGAGINKVFMSLLDKEVLYYTLNAFENNKNTDEIVVVTSADDIPRCRELVRRYRFKKVMCITEGGSERQQSVSAGLEKASGDISLIHDGARALVSDREIDTVINDCINYGAAAVGVPCKDTIKIAGEDGFIKSTVNRETAFLIQTPQAFYTEEIRSLHKKAKMDSFSVTDDCMIAEHYGKRVKISEGSYDNIKLTTPEDVVVAEQIIKRRAK